MRSVILIIPGMSDVKLAALGDKTALEAAALPGFDRLASRGRLGTAHIVPDEVPSGTVVGVPSLLGYDAVPLGLRRGPLEAAGLGIELGQQDLALRMNFVSTFRGTMADTRAGHVSNREARVLLKALQRVQSDLDLEIHFGAGYRHLVVIHAGAGMEVGTVAPQEVLGQPVQDFQPFGRDAEPLVSYLRNAAAILADHDVNRVRIDLGENPADALWFWGEGVDQSIPPFPARLGRSAAMVATAPLVRGLAAKAGMSCPALAGATTARGSNLSAKREAALTLLADHDWVVVHVAAANEASRAGDARGKVAALENIDQELCGPFVDWVAECPAERRVLVTSDHQTSVEASVRGGDPVPFAAFGPGLEGVRARSFHEASARAAGLDLPDAASLLDFFLRGGARAQSA